MERRTRWLLIAALALSGFLTISFAVRGAQQRADAARTNVGAAG